MSSTRNLGRYRVIAELARGGMANVHLAEARGPEGFSRLVVVKQLKSELAGDDVYRQMFIEEARLAARLDHRHIVNTHELGCDDGRWFMAMDFLEGASLQHVRSTLGIDAMPLAHGVRVLVAVLDALHYAHELRDDDGRPLGVVHRDVSANNVFLTYDGDVKLIDFGVAKSSGRRRACLETRVGVVKGSVPYMAPDHLDGKTIDRRADVFAVGVLLREMLTGTRLWGEMDDLSIVRRLVACELPPFPRAAGDRAPQRLLEICERATRPAREERFASAEEMKAALEGWLLDAAPRVTLESVGAWMRSELAEERAQLRGRVKVKPDAGADASAVWLPSSELATRVAPPPRPPPVPRAPRRWGARIAKAAAALALVAIGAIAGEIGDEDPAAAARAPRGVDDAVLTAASPSARAVAVQDPEEEAAPVAPTASVDPPQERGPEMFTVERLPPNPYD